MTTDGDNQELKLVTLADFDDCAFAEPLTGHKEIDMPSLSQAFQQAAATNSGAPSQVFGLLAAICGIHINAAERGSVWIPGASFGNRRTMLPSDIRGKQCDVLETVLNRVKHPSLRARLADVIWSNDLRKGAVGHTAVDAYCECIEGLLSGSLSVAFQVAGLDLLEAQRLLHRALQIGSAISKRGALPERLKSVCASLYARALDQGQHVAFSRIAHLSVEYKILEHKQVAADAETITVTHSSTNPEAVRIVLDFAGALYRRLNDSSGQERCDMGAVHQLLKMRDECPQASAKASWVMDALLRLRHIKTKEAQELEDRLEEELRRLQRASMREMGSFAIDLDMPAERERILGLFASMNFSTALKSFALLATSPNMTDLREAALKQGQESPLTSMVEAKHIDEEGKTIVKTTGAGRDQPPVDWFTRMISRSESLRRASIVANNIEPVRVLINSWIALEERHFVPIAWRSHFVSEIQAPLYALGFARFFQGDFPSAVHILVPQLEPSLRHILKARGIDPTKRRDDTTEEDRSIDALMSNHRKELEEILGAPLIEELDRVFNIQPGPTLRHDVAHGQLSAGQCYAPDAIYGCWLLYHVCCLFVMKKWEELIQPSLAIEEPGR